MTGFSGPFSQKLHKAARWSLNSVHAYPTLTSGVALSCAIIALLTDAWFSVPCALLAGMVLTLVAISTVFKTSLQSSTEMLRELYVDVASSDEESSPSILTGRGYRSGFDVFDQALDASIQTINHLLGIVRAMSEEVDGLIERYELLTTNIAAAALIRDPEGKIVFCSPYTEVLTGYSLDEIYEYPDDFLESIVLADDLDRYRRARGVSELGEDIVVRYQIRHRSGIQLWIETHMVPVADEDGQTVSVMSVSIDVTSSVRYQQKIEEQNRDLSDFTYMVSHDLKAPIFTIKGMASMLLEDYQAVLDEDGRESITHIVDGADRLEGLIKSVVEYSALSTKDIEEQMVDLQEVKQQVLSDFAQQVKDNHAEVVFDETLPAVLGEPLRIYQVFSNLIGNALKYRAPDRNPQIEVRVRDADSDRAIIDVSDNGLGIPANKLDDIFRPYQRAHGSDIEGSGIGLACVQKILSKCGGSISVKSVEGEGSTFTVMFRSPAPRAQSVPSDLARAFVD